METYDVVVIGFGPVGQIATAKLARAGHRVAAFETHAQLYGLSRAGHIDDEIMRTLQSVGAGEEFREDAVPWKLYDMRTKAFGGELLLSLDWSQIGPHGWRSHWIFYQNNLELALNHQITATGHADVHMSHEATAFEQDADGVTVTVHDKHSDTTKQVRAKYLLAADGANSFIRESLGITSTDGTTGPWQLVIDTAQKRELSFEFDNGQFADHERPGCLFQLGAKHRRWEFTLLEGENPEDFDLDRVWELLTPWVTPDDVEVIRYPVYQFKERMADEWRRDRVILIGDSAHIMWPFAGEGMCNGIRDAAALTWRLDLILRGLADEKILDTYEGDRKPNAKGWTDLSREIGIPCIITDPEIAAGRNAGMIAALSDPSLIPPMTIPPGPTAFGRKGDPGAGLPAVQGQVRTAGGETGLFDDVVGTGFTLLARDRAALQSLDDEQRSFLESIGAQVAVVGPEGSDVDLIDIDGTYTAWFDQLGRVAVLGRPDFFVFGSAADTSDTGGLVTSLRDQLAGLKAAETAAAPAVSVSA